MKKENTPTGLVCHGLQENAFQVNQLYNVTWSNLQTSLNPLVMTTAMRDIQVERLGDRKTQRCGKRFAVISPHFLFVWITLLYIVNRNKQIM